MVAFESAIKKKLAAHSVPSEVLARVQFSDPPNAALGDVALGAFPLAAFWKMSPLDAAYHLKEILLGAHDGIAEITCAGPYVNFRLKTPWLVAGAFSWNDSAARRFFAVGTRGLSDEKKLLPRAKILIEYSQPNTHKEFHIGHMRNAAYGAALVNIWRATGRRVTAVTYVNDVGAHVAKTLWALQKFHAQEKPPAERGRWLAGMYVEATRALEEHPEYKEEVSDVLRALERRDKKIFKLWRTTRRWSLAEFAQIYKELGIKFDGAFYESDVKARGHEIVDALLARGVARESQGAIIMDFDAAEPTDVAVAAKKCGARGVLILRKSNGTGNYATSDLALAEAKFKKYKPTEIVIVTDQRQSLYFKQIFATLAAFGFTQKMWHLPYELVTLPEGAMSSRKGNVVLYEQIRDDVYAHAVAETRRRHADWAARKIAAVGRALTVGAIRFSLIKQSPMSVITFDKTEALSFDGYTAPYLQYTLARINSIFKKARAADHTSRAPKNFSWNQSEKELWVRAAKFDVALCRAAERNDPSELCKYAFELAQAFAGYYEQHKVLDDDRRVRIARLFLLRTIARTLERVFVLIGVPIISAM